MPTDAQTKSPASPVLDDEALKAQDIADEENIQKLISGTEAGGGGLGINFDDDTPFDQTNKADDAQDFEDISDDDLPEEEEAAGGTSLSLPGLTDDGGTSNDTDDLFGEGGASSPLDPIPGPPSPAPRVHDPEAVDSLHNMPDFRDINFDPEPAYGNANQDPDIPAPAETIEDLVKQTWPSWQKGVILKWNELLPPKKARWIEKKPVKKPKTLVATKLSLDMAPDQEKMFRVPGPATWTRKQRLIETESKGLVWCAMDDVPEEADADEFNLDLESDSETVAGFSLQDIEMVCDDWVNRIEQAQLESARALEAAAAAESTKHGHEDDEWAAMFLEDDAPPPRKKIKRPVPTGLPEIPRFTAPSFDSFAQATQRAAKRVRLDLNDPYLLFEDVDTQRGPKKPRLDQKLTRMSNGRFGRDITQRFNLSNDEAYEALKENHQHKVRATLGNLAVEHSAPALKLAWPFYKVKLDIRRDGYHRPYFKFGKHERQTVRFSKLAHFKRKQMKGKASDVFRTTKDLGITDNSTAVLFEYCERTPPVLSNFGMGNRVINYYRKKKVEDEEVPPKLDIGESHVLLPEDRSPFAIFGEVDSGQTMPTLHNQMYRAPIFKHTARPTDFLCVRSSTGVEGSQFYLHKIDHLYVVGQTFPSVEIPGPHSRKVTNASKNRIKMISFRMMRKDENHLVNLSEITKHIAESTDAQNRQKLKEFLSYARGENAKGEKGLWGLKAGEVLLDEASIRALIKPEDVCLIDGMQLGMQMLEDAGFDPSNVVLEGDELEEDDDEDGDRPAGKGAKKGGNKDNDEKIADKLAPWKTSKAFIDACAGKAMLKLHGQGDPTGHGLGFSFMRTSMKGGYIETVQKGGSHTTANDAMAAHPDALKKAYNGHAYNVKEQEAMYRRGIREIWDKQKASLEDQTEQDDDQVVPPPADEDDRFNVQAAQTPAHVDEGVSQITGLTTSTSRLHRKRLKITRQYQISETEVETRTVIVDDPVIIDRYIKRRKEEQDGLTVYDAPKQGQMDNEASRRHLVEINKELERLNRNKQRRIGREQQKGLHKAAVAARDGGSPDADRTAPTGTTRKCANCGMVGHIKTNKKLCPMLNGTMKTDNGIAEHGGFGVYTAPSKGPGSP